MMTRTHDRTINAFPQDSDSAFCSSSATRKGKAQKLNYIFYTHSYKMGIHIEWLNEIAGSFMKKKKEIFSAGDLFRFSGLEISY